MRERPACQRGQASLEALLAFATLLIALAMLAHSASSQCEALAGQVEAADARVQLAQEALYIDISASMLPGAAFSKNLSGVPVEDGGWLASGRSGLVREPVFHRISVDGEGKYHVQE